ncbi:MAG: RdgB/HAM1 family non-canonical purine NTP pyrophosphatase [Gemmatimonadales bacterium]
MNRLLVATRSAGKQAEFRSLLAQLPVTIVFPADLDLAESAEENGLETHATFEANARAKARWFARRSGLPTLADDSGLEVDALNGAPGVHSKRFAGGDGPDALVASANNAQLLERLRDVPEAARTARYRCVLVLARTGGDEIVVSGATDGRIARAPRGSGGFGYDPLFFSDELGMTFGEATDEAKHAVSHRGRAVAALARVWV